MNKEVNYWKTAEQMNGRLAMMGFFAAVINNRLDHPRNCLNLDSKKYKNPSSDITEEAYCFKNAFFIF